MLSYENLPKSLKAEVLVRARSEDRNKQEERQKIIQSKSVQELSQIHSLSDIPVPAPVLKIMLRRRSKSSRADPESTR